PVCSLARTLSDGQLFLSLIGWAHASLCTLSLHDALPICACRSGWRCRRPARTLRDKNRSPAPCRQSAWASPPAPRGPGDTASTRDRKSTRLNSSHVKISYAVFCLKKKKQSDEAVIASHRR